MVSFSKYAGCGNDFVLFDHRCPFFPLHNQQLMKKLCHRQLGIGADGLIFLETSSSADFKMRIFNADGSEAEMCGNGIRCLYKFIQQLGFQTKAYTIETMKRKLTIAASGDDVSVEMGIPTEIDWEVNLMIEGQTKVAQHLDTGVPHAVLFVENLDLVDMIHLAPKIRYHPEFLPRGANVNFALMKSNDLIELRTYERGVEQETLACGTGAVATALAAAKMFNLKSPLSVLTRSKEQLRVWFERNGETFEQIIMSGPASLIYHGEIKIE
jgi:diaminopimelate epimerase